MTREEATSILEAFQYISAGKETKDAVITATNMAIEALSEPTGGDLISRQDAIEVIESRHTEQWIESDIDYNEGLETALCEIKALPSARPTGEWVLKGHLWECDQCGCRINRANPLKGNIWNYKFCPNCGAGWSTTPQKSQMT